MKYAVYRGDIWLEDIHADSETEALFIAKSKHGEYVRIELVSEVSNGRAG